MVYRQHFKIPHYELNPVWRQSVAQLRWFNARHLVVVCLVTSLLILLDRAANVPAGYFEFLVGTLLGAFGSVCGRHLSNLLLFWYLNRHPAEISGEVALTLRLTLRMSLFTYLGIAPLLAVMATLVPEPHVMGVFLGVLTIAFTHVVWGLRTKPTPD